MNTTTTNSSSDQVKGGGKTTTTTEKGPSPSRAAINTVTNGSSLESANLLRHGRGGSSAAAAAAASPAASRSACGDTATPAPATSTGNTTSGHSRWRIRRPEIPLKEKFTLTPWEKFVKYRRLPYKPLINFLAIVVQCIYIYGYFALHNRTERDERFGLLTFFFPDAADNTAASLSHRFTSIDHTVDWIQAVAVAYYAVPELSSGIWMHFAEVVQNNNASSSSSSATVHNSDTVYQIRAPVITVNLVMNSTVVDMEASSNTLQTETITMKLNATNEYVGPFSQKYMPRQEPANCEPTGRPVYLPCRGATNRTDFFDRILDFSIGMHFRGIRRASSRVVASIVRWTITFNCHFLGNRALLQCDGDFEPLATQHVDILGMTCLAILIVQYSAMLVLYVRALWRYRRSNDDLQAVVETLDETERLQFREALSGFSWRMYGVCCAVQGLIFCMVAAVEMGQSATNGNVTFFRNLLIGTTFFCQCVLALSHLSSSPEYNTILRVITFAVPDLCYFIVGIVPLFVGFALLFYVCFGSQTESGFGTISRSFQALFAASNGDSVLQLFTQINQAEYPAMRIMSRLFFIMYLLYFCGHAQNVIMGIIQNAYVRVAEIHELQQTAKEAAEKKDRAKRRAINNSSSNNNSNAGGSSKRDSSSSSSGSSSTSSDTSSDTSSSDTSNNSSKKKKDGDTAKMKKKVKNKGKLGKDVDVLRDPKLVHRLARTIHKMRSKKSDPIVSFN